MKFDRIIASVLAAGAAASSTSVSAQTRGGFEIGLELFDYSYRERLNGQTIVHDDGRFIGLAIDYTQRLGDNWFLRGRLSGAAGSVDYRSSGGIGFDSPARLDDVTQGIGRFELQIGRDLMLSNTTSLTPFVGFATRVLNDRSGGEETRDGLRGYDREVVYSYVPVGLALRHPLGERSALTVSAQYNRVVGGEAESRFSNLDPDLPDVKVNLNGGNGFELSAIADIPVGRRAVRVGPFMRRWSIAQSDTFVLTNPDDPTESIAFFEPQNRTTELGLKLSFAF